MLPIALFHLRIHVEEELSLLLRILLQRSRIVLMRGSNQNLYFDVLLPERHVSHSNRLSHQLLSSTIYID